MTDDRIFNVLFLCTGNSSRSIISEALVTVLGRGRFKGYSAGSRHATTLRASRARTGRGIPRPHWGYEDPAQVTGTDDEKREAFVRTFQQSRRRVEQLVTLPLDWMDDDKVRTEAVRVIAATKL